MQFLAGVPQGSVLGPLLYLINTADLPTLANSTTATFADDTAILTVHEGPKIAEHRLQMHVNKIQSWLKTWRMKAKEAKSVQVTFTLYKIHMPTCQIIQRIPTQSGRGKTPRYPPRPKTHLAQTHNH